MTVGGLSSESFSTLQQAATHRCLLRYEAHLVRITFDPKMRDTRSGLRQGDRAFVLCERTGTRGPSVLRFNIGIGTVEPRVADAHNLPASATIPIKPLNSRNSSYFLIDRMLTMHSLYFCSDAMSLYSLLGYLT